VVTERPLAAIQIGLAIFACEALGQFNQAKPGQAPGDLGWDPLNLKSEDPEIYARVQLRELKNGRLAMIAIAGMLIQVGSNRDAGTGSLVAVGWLRLVGTASNPPTHDHQHRSSHSLAD
jgi:hypothetical protein